MTTATQRMEQTILRKVFSSMLLRKAVYNVGWGIYTAKPPLGLPQFMPTLSTQGKHDASLIPRFLLSTIPPEE